MKLVRSVSNYTRSSVKKDKDRIYIFTDNCDRTSGKNKISKDSSYLKRFKKDEACYPSVTSAIIRGLENAYPVTTCKAYSKTQYNRLWTDDDFNEFKKIIDKDFEEIKKACIEKEPKEIIFPIRGILNGNYSKITYDRTPTLYFYIIKKEMELRDFEIKDIEK